MICSELEKHKNEFQIVAASDLLKDRRDKFEERYPKATAYKDFHEMFKNPEVEMVV